MLHPRRRFLPWLPTILLNFPLISLPTLWLPTLWIPRVVLADQNSPASRASPIPLISLPNLGTSDQIPKKIRDPLEQIRQEEKDIPKRTSTPPSLTRRIPIEIYQCKREFLYRNKLIGCDSRLYTDGENLRAIIKDVPDALAELDTYQSNRRRVTLMAYTGSIGLALMLFKVLPIISRDDVKDGFLIGGVAITGASALYGLSLLRENESHLANAVQKYNAARPKDPIELQFSTGFSF